MKYSNKYTKTPTTWDKTIFLSDRDLQKATQYSGEIVCNKAKDANVTAAE